MELHGDAVEWDVGCGTPLRPHAIAMNMSHILVPCYACGLRSAPAAQLGHAAAHDAPAFQPHRCGLFIGHVFAWACGCGFDVFHGGGHLVLALVAHAGANVLNDYRRAQRIADAANPG